MFGKMLQHIAANHIQLMFTFATIRIILLWKLGKSSNKSVWLLEHDGQEGPPDYLETLTFPV